ncbi:MAG TPA: terminase TerL endonuclease subunit [Roseomonas sp.]|nr:terminase TerL endonuclease subunit [Roseomonas sp.]
MTKAGGYVARANAYARSVVSGRTPACRWVVAACQRQIADLQRGKDKRWPYVFDKERAERICRFIELLPHIKGPKARRSELIRLEAWQCFILTTVFGWVHRETGLRRFKRVHIEVPRGNAKSTLSSGVALFMLAADGESGAEVYSAATHRDQAKIVWGDAHAMAQRAAGLRRSLGVETGAHSIVVPRTASKFVPLSRDSENQDGLNIHFAVIDELHAHKTREIYDVIETGAGKRDQSLIWVITTAGSNRAGICYELRGYLTQVLNTALRQWDGNPYRLTGDTAEDDQLFGIIYTLDESDDWTDPAVWPKANPNWGVSVMPDYVSGLAAKAMQLAAAQNNFKTKHLNVWVNADQAWMDMRAWDRMADPSLREADFVGESCVAALDLASKVDIAAKVKIFERQLDGLPHYYAFGTYYLPEAAVRESGNSQYAGWALQQRIITTPGEVNDFRRIRDDILDDSMRFDLREIAYDPWQAAQMAQELQEEGAQVVEFRNTVANFSEPMKELDALVRQGRLHHDGCPVLAWMISNVVCHTDAKDNIFPRKERPENKIDGVVALIMALARCMLGAESRRSVYEERGVLVLGG